MRATFFSYFLTVVFTTNAFERFPRQELLPPLTMRLQENIPGEPVIDYPIFNEIPDSAFRCSSQSFAGYYADVENRCQVFHICQFSGRQDSFLCPNGTVFDQRYFVCNWWFNVECASAPSFYSINSQLFTSSDFTQQDSQNIAFESDSLPVPGVVGGGRVIPSPNNNFREPHALDSPTTNSWQVSDPVSEWRRPASQNSAYEQENSGYLPEDSGSIDEQSYNAQYETTQTQNTYSTDHYPETEASEPFFNDQYTDYPQYAPDPVPITTYRPRIPFIPPIINAAPSTERYPSPSGYPPEEEDNYPEEPLYSEAPTTNPPRIVPERQRPKPYTTEKPTVDFVTNYPEETASYDYDVYVDSTPSEPTAFEVQANYGQRLVPVTTETSVQNVSPQGQVASYPVEDEFDLPFEAAPETVPIPVTTSSPAYASESPEPLPVPDPVVQNNVNYGMRHSNPIPAFEDNKQEGQYLPTLAPPKQTSPALLDTDYRSIQSMRFVSSPVSVVKDNKQNELLSTSVPEVQTSSQLPSTDYRNSIKTMQFVSSPIPLFKGSYQAGQGGKFQSTSVPFSSSSRPVDFQQGLSSIRPQNGYIVPQQLPSSIRQPVKLQNGLRPPVRVQNGFRVPIIVQNGMKVPLQYGIRDPVQPGTETRGQIQNGYRKPAQLENEIRTETRGQIQNGYRRPAQLQNEIRTETRGQIQNGYRRPAQLQNEIRTQPKPQNGFQTQSAQFISTPKPLQQFSTEYSSVALDSITQSARPSGGSYLPEILEVDSKAEYTVGGTSTDTQQPTGSNQVYEYPVEFTTRTPIRLNSYSPEENTQKQVTPTLPETSSYSPPVSFNPPRVFQPAVSTVSPSYPTKYESVNEPVSAVKPSTSQPLTRPSFPAQQSSDKRPSYPSEEDFQTYTSPSPVLTPEFSNQAGNIENGNQPNQPSSIGPLEILSVAGGPVRVTPEPNSNPQRPTYVSISAGYGSTPSPPVLGQLEELSVAAVPQNLLSPYPQRSTTKYPSTSNDNQQNPVRLPHSNNGNFVQQNDVEQLSPPFLRQHFVNSNQQKGQVSNNQGHNGNFNNFQHQNGNGNLNQFQGQNGNGNVNRFQGQNGNGNFNQLQGQNGNGNVNQFQGQNGNGNFNQFQDLNGNGNFIPNQFKAGGDTNTGNFFPRTSNPQRVKNFITNPVQNQNNGNSKPINLQSHSLQHNLNSVSKPTIQAENNNNHISKPPIPSNGFSTGVDKETLSLPFISVPVLQPNERAIKKLAEQVNTNADHVNTVHRFNVPTGSRPVIIKLSSNPQHPPQIEINRRMDQGREKIMKKFQKQIVHFIQ